MKKKAVKVVTFRSINNKQITQQTMRPLKHKTNRSYEEKAVKVVTFRSINNKQTMRPLKHKTNHRSYEEESGQCGHILVKI